MLKQSLQQKLLQKLSPQQPADEIASGADAGTRSAHQAGIGGQSGARRGGEVEAELDEFDNQDTRRATRLWRSLTSTTTSTTKPPTTNWASATTAQTWKKTVPLGSGSTFRELLVDQLALMDTTAESRALAEHLIGHLDDDGYLRRDLDSIVNIWLLHPHRRARAFVGGRVEVVHLLDPAGVGARDLKECLLLQVHRKQADKDEATPSTILWPWPSPCCATTTTRS